MEKETRAFIFAFGSAMMTLLFSGNLYFIKRLVDKLDDVEQRVWQLKNEVVILKVTMESKNSWGRK